MKNVAKEVDKRIRELLTTRESELSEIRAKMDEYRAISESAAAAMEKATEVIDPAEYIEANKRKQEADIAVEMYRKRHEQYANREFISEDDSDAVLDSLSEYEAALAEEFRRELADPIKRIEVLFQTYTEKVDEAERVINNWTSSIHANHHIPGARFPDGTDRAPYATRFRSYGLWEKSNGLKVFIDNMVPECAVTADENNC